jgi:glycosyltransferase involved in cell wall biosynthesis
MKVLFTIDSLQQGGAEQSIANIIRHFSDDVEVTVLYFYPKSDLLPVYQQLNCRIVSLGLTGKYEWRKAIAEMKKVLHSVKPDIVVTSLYRSNIISRMACKSCGIKLIGTFVDDSYNPERKATFKGIGRLKYQFTWLLDRLTSSIPYAWISNSRIIGETNAQRLGLSLNKIKVIYRGRDTTVFPTWQAPTHEVFKFICIGRLYEKKGYPELLDAFIKLTQKHNNVVLEILGEGDYRAAMENKIQSAGLEHSITLSGNVPNAWRKLYEANCFVFPSRFEGFSGALVEAMMTGIPIISSDIPMNTEAVTHGETALVHKLRDVDDLYIKMDEMINHYESMKAMGEKARKVAFERFDIKVIANQYEMLLKDFVNNKL